MILHLKYYKKVHTRTERMKKKTDNISLKQIKGKPQRHAKPVTNSNRHMAFKVVLEYTG